MIRTATMLLALVVVAGQASAATIFEGIQAPSLGVDPSVRAAGMGGIGGAVFWGDHPNAWANPALAAYQRGIGFEYGRTKLVPDLADDVYFTTRQASLGVAGVGFVCS